MIALYITTIVVVSVLIVLFCLEVLLWRPTYMTFNMVVPTFEELPPTEGIQKVAGFSRGQHHKDSVRIGIRNEGNKGMKFYPYFWIDGKLDKVDDFSGAVDGLKGNLIIPPLHWGHVQPGTSISVRMGYTPTSVFIGVEWDGCPERTSTWRKRLNWLFPVGYKLGSYFEYDGQNFKSRNVDYKINNLTIK